MNGLHDIVLRAGGIEARERCRQNKTRYVRLIITHRARGAGCVLVCVFMCSG